MITPGDTVRVIGTAMGPDSPYSIAIPIGSICTAAAVEGGLVLIEDSNGVRFWYPESSLEKGQLVWVKEQDYDSSIATWLISGTGLPTLEIQASSFDEAIDEARKIDPNYNTGQVKEDTI